jgi:N-carbamoylputrescine amidase
VAVTQMACSWDRDRNIRRAVEMVEDAASKGAQLVLLQELFETPYFCIETDEIYFKEATTLEANPAIRALRKAAARHHVVVPVSFYEAADDGRRFNSLAVVDADGELLGVYRKSHIPDFPAYEEAFYFSPGDSGFKVWKTRYVNLGCGICWDQWFPETARIMTLMGAELLMYPTAIGRPTKDSPYEIANSKPHWQRTMQGHAAANQVILAASNRVGVESGKKYHTQFYGGSFIASETGAKVVELGEDESSVAVYDFDLDRIAEFRKAWGIFRTRRPDLYEPLINQPAPQPLMERR